MSFASLLWLGAGAALAGAAMVWLWRIERGLAEVRARQNRLEEILRDRARQAQALQKLFDLQQRTESGIEQGLAAARAIHRGAAKIPLDILDAIPETRQTAERLRKVHERLSRDLGDTAGALNRALGEAARSALSEAAKAGAQTRPARQEERKDEAGKEDGREQQ